MYLSPNYPAASCMVNNLVDPLQVNSLPATPLLVNSLPATPLQGNPSPQTFDFNLPSNNLDAQQVFPCTSDVKAGNWPYMSFQNDLSGADRMDIDNPVNLSLRHIDTKELPELQSSELNLLDVNNLSETLNNLSFSDCNSILNEDNMADSITTLANNTMNNIMQLNEMCKHQNL